MPYVDVNSVKASIADSFVEPRLSFSMNVPQHYQGKRWFFSNGFLSVGSKTISTLHVVGHPNHWNYNPKYIQGNTSVTDSLTLVAEVSPTALRFIQRNRNADGDVLFQLELYFHTVRYEVRFSADNTQQIDNLFLSDDIQQESLHTRIHQSEWVRRFMPKLSGRAYHLLEIPEINLNSISLISHLEQHQLIQEQISISIDEYEKLSSYFDKRDAQNASLAARKVFEALRTVCENYEKLLEGQAEKAAKEYAGLFGRLKTEFYSQHGLISGYAHTMKRNNHTNFIVPVDLEEINYFFMSSMNALQLVLAKMEQMEQEKVI